MTTRTIRCGIAAAAAFLFFCWAPLVAQQRGPSPVGVTAARQHPVRQTVELTGSVEAVRASVVASEIAGPVVELVVREGDAVRRGDPLVRLRRRRLELDLERVAAELREAQARLELAEQNLERRQDLFQSQVVSRQDLDDAVSERTAWRGRAESLEAEKARVEDNLEQSVVRAPFAGVVVREHVQVGEWVGMGDPVAELVGLDELEVVLQVPERYFDDLEPGVRVTRIAFEALPGHTTEGRVAAIIPRADLQARTFPVKVRLGNPERRIAVGMLARIELPVGEPVPATVVPKDALVRQGPGEVVFVVGEDDTVQPVGVDVGGAAGPWVAVAGPVEPGDRVVTRGNERLLPGAQVESSEVEYELP